MDTQTLLAVANLTDPVDRAMLADHLDDVGRVREAALLRRPSALKVNARGEIKAVRPEEMTYAQAEQIVEATITDAVLHDYLFVMPRGYFRIEVFSSGVCRTLDARERVVTRPRKTRPFAVLDTDVEWRHHEDLDSGDLAAIEMNSLHELREAVIESFHPQPGDPYIEQALKRIHEAFGEYACTNENPTGATAWYDYGNERPWRIGNDWDQYTYRRFSTAVETAMDWRNLIGE